VSVNREAFGELLAHVPGVKMTMREIMARHLSTPAPLQEEILATVNAE
jgi:hypothetical protein